MTDKSQIRDEIVGGFFDGLLLLILVCLVIWLSMMAIEAYRDHFDSIMTDYMPQKKEKSIWDF